MPIQWTCDRHFITPPLQWLIDWTLLQEAVYTKMMLNTESGSCQVYRHSGRYFEGKDVVIGISISGTCIYLSMWCLISIEPIGIRQDAHIMEVRLIMTPPPPPRAQGMIWLVDWVQCETCDMTFIHSRCPVTVNPSWESTPRRPEGGYCWLYIGWLRWILLNVAPSINK